MARGKRQMKSSFRWRPYAAALCALLSLVFGFLTFRDLFQSAKEQSANDELALQVHEARTALAGPVSKPDDPSQPEPPPKYAASGNLYQYDALWQMNQDMAGWLFIEGTRIDLPVMCTPKNSEYYLRRAFDGSYARGGCLFLGKGWTPESNSAIIYGHNMKNGSMFGTLDLYADGDYAKDHPICFDTLKEEGEYTVLAAFYSRVYTDKDQGVFRYYQYTDLSEEETFLSYVSQAKEASLYDTGVEARYGDRLLTLSTCSYHQKDGRFVVVAVQKLDETQQADSPD